MRFKINPLYKFWIIPTYTSIEGGKPTGFEVLPTEQRPHPDNLPKEDDARAIAMKAHYGNPTNTVDRVFTWAMIPTLEQVVEGRQVKLVALWYEPTADRRRQGDRRLMFVDSGYLIPAE